MRAVSLFLLSGTLACQSADSGRAPVTTTTGRSSRASPSPQSDPGLIVPLWVSEPSGVKRENEPITIGVPLPAEPGYQIEDLALFDGDRPVEVQMTALSTWPSEGRPLRWVLLDFQTSLEAGETRTLGIRRRTANSGPSVGVRVEDSAQRLAIDTGALRIEIEKNSPHLFDTLTVGGQVRARAAQVVVVDARGRRHPAKLDAPPALEHQGPLRAVVRLGHRLLDDPSVRVVTRIEVHRGAREVRLRTELQNNRPMHRKKDVFDPKSPFEFRALTVETDLELGGDSRQFGSDRYAGAQPKSEPWRLFQGHRVMSAVDESKNFEYRITGRKAQTGGRHPGWFRVSGEAGGLTVAMRWFWQNYEKAFSVANDRLSIELWPKEGSFPKSRGGVYRLAGGRRKSHEYSLDFGGGDPVRFIERVVPRAPPEWYRETYALGPIDAGPPAFASQRGYRAYERYNETMRNFVGATLQPASPREPIRNIHEAKEVRGVVGGDYDAADWYGWPHFGDLAWGTGEYSSNHYDLPAFLGIHFLRLGDRAFWDLAEPHMRFSSELGQYWADDPSPGFTSLSFYEKTDHGAGPPSTQHLPSHNWLKRLVLYHWLTGDPVAKDAALTNGAGLVRYFYGLWFSIEQPEKIEFPTGWSVLTEPRFVTWTLDACLDLYALTAEPEWMKRAEDMARAILFIFDQTGHINGGEPPKDGAGLMTHYGLEPLLRFHIESKNAALRARLLTMFETVLLDTYGVEKVRGAKGHELVHAAGEGKSYRPACTKLSWDRGQGRACLTVFNGFVASLYAYVGAELLASGDAKAVRRAKRYLGTSHEVWQDGVLYPGYQSPSLDPAARGARDQDGFDHWYWINGFPNSAEKVNARLARMGMIYLWVQHRLKR